MRHSIKSLLSVLFGTVLVCAAATGPAMAGSAEEYIDTQLRVVHDLETRIDAIADAADLAVQGLVAGGNVYLAGEPGMVSELLGRAGGLCGAKAIARDKPLPPFKSGDVVLLSDYGQPKGPSDHRWNDLTASDALVVAFASFENPLVQQPLPVNVRPIPVRIPSDSRLVRTASGERLIPAAPPAIAIAEWTYVAELIGACRRQHRQLAVYLSIFLDEGHRRLKRTTGLLFEPGLHPAPVARGRYAREFLAQVRTSLAAIRTDEIEKIRLASRWLAEASAAGRKIVRNFQGHLPPVESGMPGDVGFFTMLVRAAGREAANWVRDNMHKDDVYLLLGYQDSEDGTAAAANAVGVRTIFITSRAPGAEAAASPRHLYIDPHWPVTDGCLELPGYDVKACPLSCIMGLTCYYAVCGESLRP